MKKIKLVFITILSSVNFSVYAQELSFDEFIDNIKNGQCYFNNRLEIGAKYSEIKNEITSMKLKFYIFENSAIYYSEKFAIGFSSYLKDNSFAQRIYYYPNRNSDFMVNYNPNKFKNLIEDHNRLKLLRVLNKVIYIIINENNKIENIIVEKDN